jgi:glycosyltransferase involved in cell wall biosynthesis
MATALLNSSSPEHIGGRRRVRVLFLIPAFDIGGAERVVARTAMSLDRHRFEPIVAGFVPGSGRLLEQLQGVSSLVVGEQKASVTLAWRLLRTLRQTRPDILLTYMFHANVAGRLLGRLSGVRTIVSSERVVGWEPRWRILVNRATAGLATAVTTNSLAGRAFWARNLGLSPEKIHVLYNGIDLAEFPVRDNVSTGPTRFGVLARLHSANGHRWLLDGLKQLEARVPAPWTCEFAGDGPELIDLRNRVHAMGLATRVMFVGHRSDASCFLRSLHAYIHPSLVSGMPNAVLEAMASGLPVIATAVGGTPEAVQHGSTGWLVTPGDVQEFVKHAAYVTQNRDAATEMGRRARRRIEEEFSLKVTTQAIEKLLVSLAMSPA